MGTRRVAKAGSSLSRTLDTMDAYISGAFCGLGRTTVDVVISEAPCRARPTLVECFRWRRRRIPNVSKININMLIKIQAEYTPRTPTPTTTQFRLSDNAT